MGEDKRHIVHRVRLFHGVNKSSDVQIIEKGTRGVGSEVYIRGTLSPETHKTKRPHRDHGS